MKTGTQPSHLVSGLAAAAVALAALATVAAHWAGRNAPAEPRVIHAQSAPLDAGNAVFVARAVEGRR